MKKTISINISGVIFHIEEDGYDKLKGYLTSIQHYFSTYEDSQEIITDIENRIAEKLLNKLKAAEKQASPRQVVTLEDVNELIQSMGTVADFEAIEEEDSIGVGSSGSSRPQPTFESARPAGESRDPKTGSATGTGPVPPRPANVPPRKLYRDLRRKIAGGVASGIANYFNIDPVWVRLVFVTLILALPPFSGIMGGGGEFFGGLSGFTVVLYIAMWVAFPGSTTLEDDKSVKKFYRNPDDKVLGGVASGIAAYFGTDAGVVRLLFVLTIFLFGTGFLAYLVLWIISPTANTLTEKMEMQGEPITLSNIESNIKRSLDINETAEESTAAKILLFPFRIIAMIFNGLASLLGPLARGTVSIVRVLAGVFLVVVGFAIMMAALGVLGTVFGLRGIHFGGSEIPYMLQREISPPMILSAFVAVFLPGLGLAILGIMIISQRALVTTGISLTLLCIWFLGLVGLAATIPQIVNEFSRTGVVEETEVIQLPAPIPTLDINDVDDNNGNFHTAIELEGIDGASWKLLKRYEAQGPTRQEAQRNAKTVIYNWAVKDSLVRFDDSYEIKSGARFRDQDIDLIVYVPYERPFRMTEAFARHIRNEFGNEEIERMKSSIWKFTKADGLVSLNGPRQLNEDHYERDFDTNDAIDEVLRNELGDDFNHKGEYTRQFEAANFSKIDMGGAFAVRIKHDSTFRVVADGREEDIDDLRVRVENGELHVDFRDTGILKWKNRKRIGITVSMPNVNSIHFSGATQSIVSGFDNIDNLDVDLTGACKTLLDVKTNKIDLDLTGASKATLRGRTNSLNAQLSGACKLDATAMNVGRADVSAAGASNAEFGTVTDLNSKTSGASSVNGPHNQE
ncbi:PspC domain-containing protein [Larkinella rosea]|uniref:PspC domain-containing protein n=1 Tax=Larkinella rosea TaxID=2025312 RepID=A0A3P1BTT4_9BACT|nr:PspC domain-containing protein [Larkinella rosea]RRB04339.1 PspC domain-containing protein [Larkinella rosea]